MTAQAGGAALLKRSIGHPCHDDREKSKKRGFCFSPPRRCKQRSRRDPSLGPSLISDAIDRASMPRRSRERQKAWFLLFSATALQTTLAVGPVLGSKLNLKL